MLYTSCTCITYKSKNKGYNQKLIYRSQRRCKERNRGDKKSFENAIGLRNRSCKKLIL